MANFLIRNSLNPYKVIKCNLTFQQQVLKGSEGEHIWVVEVNTIEPDINGDPITSEYVHLRTLDDLDDEIENVANRISAQIDWSPRIEDTKAPYVTSYSPTETSDVDIDSSVILTIKESLPSAGIDIGSIVMTVDDFDVTPEVDITGDPYEYKIEWKPSVIIRDTYE